MDSNPRTVTSAQVSAPQAPNGTHIQPAVASAHQAQVVAPGRPPGLLDRIIAFFKTPVGATVGLALAVVAVAAAATDKRPSRKSLPAGRRLPAPTAPRRDELLAINRENGKFFEDMVGEALQDEFPGAAVIPQVHVVTPEGKKRRLDFALAHANGSVTSVEVKNVLELREKHVCQAEDHRAGLRNTHAVRSGLPIVAVPIHTLVSEDHATRIRVVRVRTRT